MEEEVTLKLSSLGRADMARLSSWVRAYYAYDSIAYDASVEAALAELLADPGLGIAVELFAGGVAVGYSIVTYGFDHEFGGRLGVLTDFFIQEQSRGHGLGMGFLQLILGYAKDSGLKGMEIPVMKDNTRARTLYEKFGFKQSERMDHLFRRF